MADNNYAGGSPIPMVAGGVIIANTFVKLNSSQQVVQATAQTDSVCGVALNAAAAAGDQVQVFTVNGGIVSVISNGTVTAGGEIECAADGEATDAGGATAYSCGQAIDAATVDQEKVRIFFRPSVKCPANS